MKKSTVLQMMDQPGRKGQVHRSLAMWDMIAQQFEFKTIKELLEVWYVEESLTTTQCAYRFQDNFVDVKRGRVLQLLKECGIVRRSPGRLPTHVIIEGLNWSKSDKVLCEEEKVNVRTMQRWRVIARRERAEEVG